MPAEPVIESGIRIGLQGRHPDRAIADLAEGQHGVVSRVQLLGLGLSGGAIVRRIERGYLHCLHTGVYAVGQRQIRPEGHLMAAVLGGGAHAVLSHASAAVLWGIRRPGTNGWIEIASPVAMRSIRGVRRHEVRHLPKEVTWRKRIPVTTLKRTILDISATIRVEALEAAVREAQYLHGLEMRSLDGLLREYKGRRGIRSLRACLDNLGAGPRGRTRSPLEDRFASILARADLSLPELNALVEIEGSLIEADCLWRDRRVIVELDGRAAHQTDAAFRSDRARDRKLQALGWKVARVTWDDLDEPEAVLAEVRGMLNPRLSSL
jgi:very-short-patch-repair endonuclease